MPSDLTVPRIASATAVSGERPPSVPSRPPVAAEGAVAGSALPNPTLRLDAGLAMVVIEFRDESGAVRASIPSQQQLDAYRAWERSKTGPPPRGAPAAPGVEAPVPESAPAVKDAETTRREDGGSPS
jgi:hypothetical protein